MKSTKTKEWKDCSFNNPDFNPIENILSIIKTLLMKKEIKKRSKLIKIIKEEYDNVSEETKARLTESFSSRFHQWIE